MSNAGKKLLKALDEAVAVARGDLDAISKIKVTPSCGCVFCDLKLKPRTVKGVKWHYAPNGWVDGVSRMKCLRWRIGRRSSKNALTRR